MEQIKQTKGSESGY